MLKCLTVIDEFTRECLAIDVAGSIRSGRVIDVLTRLVSVHGAPRYRRSDNGPEFVSRAVLRWLLATQIETAFIDPGKPWQNGVDESFNGKFRNEHLSLQWFRNRVDAVVSIEHWRRHFNEVRPHSSLSYRTPHECKAITETTTRTGRSGRASSTSWEEPCASTCRRPASPGRATWARPAPTALNYHEGVRFVSDPTPTEPHDRDTPSSSGETEPRDDDDVFVTTSRPAAVLPSTAASLVQLRSLRVAEPPTHFLVGAHPN